MKEICWVKKRHESSDRCLHNRLVSLPVIEPSFFPIARMNPTTICFPEFFLYLAGEVGKNRFYGISSKPASEKRFLEV